MMVSILVNILVVIKGSKFANFFFISERISILIEDSCIEKRHYVEEYEDCRSNRDLIRVFGQKLEDKHCSYVDFDSTEQSRPDDWVVKQLVFQLLESFLVFIAKI